MGRNSFHFPGIALGSTGASVFQPIKTRHAEHSSWVTGPARQIYVHMGNFHPTSLRCQGEISPNLAGSFPM